MPITRGLSDVRSTGHPRREVLEPRLPSAPGTSLVRAASPHGATPSVRGAEPRVERSIEEHGYICPGFNREPHAVEPSNILTADHIEPTSLGGDPGGELRALCPKRATSPRVRRNRLRFPSRRSR